MIYESIYWKNDLIKQAAILRKRITQKRWTDISFARLEQTIMLGFYSIRKLIEAKKLSNSTVDQNICLIAYPCGGQLVTRLNRHNLDELYDFNASQQIHRDLTFICHQFVHSYVFIPNFDEYNQLDSILFASDREKNKLLYLIQIKQIIDIFNQVGNDYPTQTTMIFNPKIQNYEVQAKAENIEILTEEDFRELINHSSPIFGYSVSY